MKLPIRLYGDPVLRKKCVDIDAQYPELESLIDSMYETMKHAHGIGLAAPQIGLPIRLFVVDASPLATDKEYAPIAAELSQYKKVFINAKIISEEGKLYKFNEGCLSIPEIREDVERHETIHIEYYDAQFQFHSEIISDVRARIIQHEYDHIEGKLFIDHLSGLKKRLLKRKLENISKGKIIPDYKYKIGK